MSQPTKPIVIRKFAGISTLVNETDLPPGTLTYADGVNTIPENAISFGPSWLYGWNRTTLGADIQTALSGADATKTHFVTLTRSGTTFLVAYDLANSRPRGIWHVGGIIDPSFASLTGSSISAPSSSPYRDYTAGLNWFGSWVQNQLWLGNGTDTNLAWVSGALTILGPTTAPADAQDPSQFQFPPCTCWLPGGEGYVYGGGNVTNPTRLWSTEAPSITYPCPQGIKTQSYSYLDLQVNATGITGLSSFGRDLIVHLNVGPPYIVAGHNGSSGGWKLNQSPTSANASSINPACCRDTKLGTYYLGSDLELYLLPTFRGSIVDRGYDKSESRDGTIVTKKSPGQWNSDATKPIIGNDYFQIFDERNNRTWMWMNAVAGGRQSVYCYDARTESISGAFRYPDFLAACQLRDDNLASTIVCGITRDGAFLWADLGAMNKPTFPDYLTPLPAACLGTASPPTVSPGVPYIGIDPVNSAFVQVLNGQTLYLASPWSIWSASGSVTPTLYYARARLFIAEFAECDAGSQAIQKEFVTLRTIWNRNSIAMIGVYAQVNGASYGAWRGLQYPSIDWVNGIGGEGSTVKIRLIGISFNDYPSILSGCNIDYLPSIGN